MTTNGYTPRINPKLTPTLDEVTIDSPTAMRYKIGADATNGCIIIAFPGPVQYFVSTATQAIRLRDLLNEAVKHASNMADNVLPTEDYNYAVHVEAASCELADELNAVRDTLTKTSAELRDLQVKTDPLLHIANCLPDPPSEDFGYGAAGRINYAISARTAKTDEVAELTNVGVAQAVETSAYHSFTEISRKRAEAIRYLEAGESDNALAALRG